MLVIILHFLLLFFVCMKRAILLLVILTTHITICCASFPLDYNLAVDTLQTEEIKKYHYNLQQMGFELSSCKCISCRNGIDPIVVKPDPLPIKLENIIEAENRETSGSVYVFLSIFSVIGSILFGLLSLGNAFSSTGSYSGVLLFFLLSVISVIGSVILAVKAMKKGVKWWVIVLCFGIAFLAVLFLFPLFFV